MRPRVLQFFKARPGPRRPGPLPVAALPGTPHWPERLAAPEPLLEPPIDRNVQVRGDVPAHREARLRAWRAPGEHTTPGGLARRGMPASTLPRPPGDTAVTPPLPHREA